MKKGKLTSHKKNGKKYIPGIFKITEKNIYPVYSKFEVDSHSWSILMYTFSSKQRHFNYAFKVLEIGKFNLINEISVKIFKTQNFIWANTVFAGL